MSTTEQQGSPVFTPETQALGERFVADILTTGAFDVTQLQGRDNREIAQIYGYVVGQLSIIIDKFLDVYPEPQRDEIRKQMVQNFEEGRHGLQREPALITEEPAPAATAEPATTSEPAANAEPPAQEFGEGRANQYTVE
jgi:hypothetical protein